MRVKHTWRAVPANSGHPSSAPQLTFRLHSTLDFQGTFSSPHLRSPLIHISRPSVSDMLHLFTEQVSELVRHTQTTRVRQCLACIPPHRFTTNFYTDASQPFWSISHSRNGSEQINMLAHVPSKLRTCHEPVYMPLTKCPIFRLSRVSMGGPPTSMCGED